MYQVLCGKSLGGQWTFPIASAQHFESNMAREVLLSVARKHLPSEKNVISAIGGGTCPPKNWCYLPCTKHRAAASSLILSSR